MHSITIRLIPSASRERERVNKAVWQNSIKSSLAYTQYDITAVPVCVCAVRVYFIKRMAHMRLACSKAKVATFCSAVNKLPPSLSQSSSYTPAQTHAGAYQFYCRKRCRAAPAYNINNIYINKLDHWVCSGWQCVLSLALPSGVKILKRPRASERALDANRNSAEWTSCCWSARGLIFKTEFLFCEREWHNPSFRWLKKSVCLWKSRELACPPADGWESVEKKLEMRRWFLWGLTTFAEKIMLYQVGTKVSIAVKWAECQTLIPYWLFFMSLCMVTEINIISNTEI